jgi:hypothetical protein
MHAHVARHVPSVYPSEPNPRLSECRIASEIGHVDPVNDHDLQRSALTAAALAFLLATACMSTRSTMVCHLVGRTA